MSICAPAAGIFSSVLVATTILQSFLGEPFLSLMIVYFAILAIIVLSNAGKDSNYLVQYIFSKIDVKTDLKSDESDISSGSMIVNMPQEDADEEFQQGMHKGYPESFLILLLLAILTLILTDLCLHWNPSDQLYGLFQGTIGSVIVVQDRVRDTDILLTQGITQKGRSWMEAVFGFALISIGFLLQLIAAIL